MRVGFFLKSGMALALTLAVAGCGGRKAKAAPDVSTVEPKAEAPADKDAWKKAWAFELREGMSRAEVEAALGKPAHSGVTKEGNAYVMYSPEGAPEGYYRSVVYTKEGTVITWYR